MNLLALSQACFYFNKLSAYQFGEEEGWIPEKFKKLDVFEKFPAEKVEKIFSSFGLNDFITEINLNEFSKQDYAKDIILTMKEYVANAISIASIKRHKDLLEILINLEYFYKLLESREYTLDSLRLKNDDKTLNYPAKTNAIKIYNDFLDKLKPISLELDINFLTRRINYDDYKDFERTSPMYLVFSTKATDIAGMSSRGIESCQSLFGKEQCFKLTDYNKNLAGSILSKYVGICYLTRKSDYKGRGWKMISRAVIRQVIDGKTWKPFILIDKLYPVVSTQIYNIIKKEIEKHSSVPVITYNEIASKPFFSQEFEEDIPQEYTSYHDIGLGNYKDILKLVKSAYYEDRLHATKILKPEDLLILINDPEPKVRNEVAKRIPIQYIDQLMNDSASYVRYQVVERLAKEAPEKLKEMIKESDAEYIIEKIAEEIPEKDLHLLIYPGQYPNILSTLAHRLPLDQLYLIEPEIVWFPSIKSIVQERTQK